MLLYAGIDEAGYGPMLGPLCVGCAAFALHDDAGRPGPDAAPDLWKLLRRGVCRNPRDRRRRLAIDDSKKLKRPNQSEQPLVHLERAVLAFAPAATSDEDLFARLGVSVPDLPWYASVTALPLAHGADELRVAAAPLRRAMEAAGVGCQLLACEAVSAEALNRRVQAMGNKAAVNLGFAMQRLEELWRRWPGECLRVVVDRQGGRTRYLRALHLCFPDARIRVLAEDAGESRYRLGRAGGELTVSFVPGSETRHFPVALASMVAKYVRELFMLRMNRFFQARVPHLRPTAGYVADARRYLVEIKPVIERLEVPARTLVRSV